MIGGNTGQYNPKLRPDWRLDRVLGMVSRISGNPGRCTARDDVYVKGLRNFILRYRNASDAQARKALEHENGGLFYAYEIYEARDDEDGRYDAAMIEARLLAAQSDEDIAAELHTLPETVEWYEALFFNVRDRLSSHDWIVSRVLMPSLAAGSQRATAEAAASRQLLSSIPLSRLTEPFFDVTMKFFAYYGGKFVLDYVISGFRRGDLAHSRDEICNWFDNHTGQRLRHRSAVSSAVFQVTEANVMQLFAVHTKLIEIERNNDTVENKQDQQHRSLKALLGEMPWAAGRAGASLVAGTEIARYDAGAAELRDDELQHFAVGEVPATIEGVDLLTMPKPRIKGQEDRNGQIQVQNSQQGS